MSRAYMVGYLVHIYTWHIVGAYRLRKYCSQAGLVIGFFTVGGSGFSGGDT